MANQYICNSCTKRVGNSSICCDICNGWSHRKCADLTLNELKLLGESDEKWFCGLCIRSTFPFSDVNNDDFVENPLFTNIINLKDDHNEIVNSLNQKYKALKIESNMGHGVTKKAQVS